MNYSERLILSNKHHVTSALYHLRRVTLDDVVGVQDLKTIKEQLELWERNLFLDANKDESG